MLAVKCMARYGADERPRIAFDRHTVNGGPEMDKPMSDLEEILSALYESEINASISWLWDGGSDVMLGDELSGLQGRREGQHLC